MVPRYARHRRATLRCASHLGHPPRDRNDANIPTVFRAVPFRHHSRNVPRRLRLRVDLTYSRLSAAIRAYANGFLPIVARHTRIDGRLAEQFGKASGVPATAADLSWSYAAVLTGFTMRGRKGPVVPGVQRIWKSSAKTPGYRGKDDHLRCTLMYIDGPQSITASTTV